MLIKVCEIYKIYNPGSNEVRALNGVSLEINHGEFIAIIGSSGSGKTTLMNMLGCLDTPTLGQYFLNGENVSKMSDKKLSIIRNRLIGFVFQGFNLIPGLNALENVELPLVYRRLPRDKRIKMAVNALKKVGLENRMHHLPGQMSGGQQQRVAIARAIVAHPPIILADEPTGNLDTRSGKEVLKILKDLNNEGHTVVLITHDLAIASQAKRMVRLSDGKIVKDSAPFCNLA